MTMIEDKENKGKTSDTLSTCIEFIITSLGKTICCKHYMCWLSIYYVVSSYYMVSSILRSHLHSLKVEGFHEVNWYLSYTMHINTL